MAVKRCESNIDVVKAAEIRIKNVFGNGLPVFFSFSGGKDSLCVAQLMVNLANRGEIDMKQLTVQFIDEEAIFPCINDKSREQNDRKETGVPNLRLDRQRYYGDGKKCTKIYNVNKSVLNKAAKKHGYSNCRNGNLIFPGTTITIP